MPTDRSFDILMVWIRKKKPMMFISNHLWICGVSVWYPLLLVRLRRVHPLKRGSENEIVLFGSLEPEKKQKQQKQEEVIELDDLESPMVKEVLEIVEQEKDDSDYEANNMQDLLEKCEDAKRTLSKCINEMRDCINCANKV